MIAVLRFLLSAHVAGVAYIDVDGCILEKFPVPSRVSKHIALEWWKANLRPTPIVWQRIALLYVLRALGVRLILWTNRAPKHRAVTWRALGRHWDLFSEMRFYDGEKEYALPSGPVMDDQEKYVALGVGHSLLVASR